MHYPATKLIDAPAAEPISITEARTQVSLGSSTDWDTFLTSCIKAARARVEKETGRRLITQTWEAYPSDFGGASIILPYGKLQSVTAFEWTDTAGTAHTWTVNSGNLTSGGVTMAHIDTISDPGRITLAYSQSWPDETLKTSNPIRIRFVCGYGDAGADVPETIKAAMLLDIGFLFRFRESVVATDRQALESKPLPKGYDALLDLDNTRLYLV